MSTRISVCATSGRKTVLSISFSLALLVLASSLAPASSAAPVDDLVWNVWSRTDLAVAERQTDRTWIWGPEAHSSLLTEDYADSPDGERAVQYFDKSRMEVNDARGGSGEDWSVTNGLLARDLVLGQVQVGDDEFRSFDPPRINVAGDFDDPDGPTYRTFRDVMSSGPLPEGSTITQTIDRSGAVRDEPSFADYRVTASHYESATDHTVASPFWDFMHRTGTVYQGSEFVEDEVFWNPYYATGYPLTEPYWTTVRVDGEPNNVLIQVFERRVLTYTPDNPEGWQVEAGNVGLHYYHWYYDILPGHTSEPADGSPKQAESLPGDDAAACLDPVEQEFLGLINDYRRANGVGELENSRALNISSHNHSEDMGERSYVDHVSPEGAEPWDRMNDVGYDFNTIRAENIAAGYASAGDVFDAWKDSPSHNRTMLDPDLKVIGVGRVEAPGSKLGVYWTTNFGGHVDTAPRC